MDKKTSLATSPDDAQPVPEQQPPESLAASPHSSRDAFTAEAKPTQSWGVTLTHCRSGPWGVTGTRKVENSGCTSKTVAFLLQECSGHGVTLFLFAWTWCPLLTAVAWVQQRPQGSGQGRSSLTSTFIMGKQFMFSVIKFCDYPLKTKAFYETQNISHLYVAFFFCPCLSILISKVGVFLCQKICIQLLIIVRLQVVWTPIKPSAESVPLFSPSASAFA